MSWYEIVGDSLVLTLLIDAFMPIIETAIGTYFVQKAKKNDRGTWSRQYKVTVDENENEKVEQILSTKTTSIFDYLELYSGPAFFIHLKYSIIIKIIVVTLMYGVFIPACYLWAFLALLIFYVVEKYQIFYFYKKPAMHNANLCLFVMENMQWVPLLGYIMGFWAMTNN